MINNFIVLGSAFENISLKDQSLDDRFGLIVDILCICIGVYCFGCLCFLNR